MLLRDRRPLYEQITESIRKRTMAGELQPGERLPSEPELAERYGVSRATVREALRVLEKEGVVRSRRGQGTFVVGTRGRLQVGIDSLYSVTHAIERLGHKPGTRDAAVSIRDAGTAVRNALGLGPGARVAEVERTRLADRSAVVYSVDTVPLSLLSDPDWRRKVAEGSLFDALLQFGVSLSHSQTRFRAVRAGKRVAERLGLKAGAPVLLMEETVYDSQDRPVVMSRDYYRTDRIEVQLVRRREL